MIIRKLAQILCALTLFAACLLGQTVSSGLQGTVMDPANAVVPGATVTLTNSDTGTTRVTTTDSTGLFRFLDLAPDTYSVSVKATGFKGYTQNTIVLAANETRDAGKFTLTLGSGTEPITAPPRCMEWCGYRPGGKGRGGPFQNVWPRTAPRHGEDVRSTRRPERVGEGQNSRDKGELHWRSVAAVGHRVDGGDVLVASQDDCGDGTPDGQGRRQADPGGGRPLVDHRNPGRGHVFHELEAAGYPERRQQRGIREYQLLGAGEEKLPVHGARRGGDIPRL